MIKTYINKKSIISTLLLNNILSYHPSINHSYHNYNLSINLNYNSNLNYNNHDNNIFKNYPISKFIISNFWYRNRTRRIQW
jgi:hypothetical protein